MDMKFNLLITTEILKIITQLDEFKGRWSATHSLAPERLASLKQVATIESVGSSTRIEGVKLSNQEIENLLRSVKAQAFRSRDEQEVAGYAEAMDLIFTSFKEIPFNENSIKQLHSVLLKFSSKDERHRGEYKKFPNNVEAFDSKGKSLGIIFETVSPFETPKKMQELIEWTSNEIQKKEMHRLLIISTFIVVFLYLHPFQDGNGRLSRVLTTLLLLQAEYTYVPFSSLERVIEENKDSYYLALRKAQENLHEDNADLGEWIIFFLRSMQKQKINLEHKITGEGLLSQIPKLSVYIVEIIKQHGAVSVAEIVALTKANRNTVKLHLKTLVQKGFLILEGKGRGVRYRLK